MLAQRQRAEHTHDHRAPLRGAPRQVPGRVPVEHPKRKAGKQQAKGSITLHRNAAVQALEDGDIESPAGKSDDSNHHHKDRADSGEVLPAREQSTIKLLPAHVYLTCRLALYRNAHSKAEGNCVTEL